MKFYVEIDRVIKEVNNIDDKKLKSIDLEYLKCKRVGKYLFMVTLFNSVFLTRMEQIYINLSAIEYPNTIFKCYGVIVIDLDRNRFIGHRMYSFPTNLDLYGNKNHNKMYDDIEKQILDNKMVIEFDLPFTISSSIFDTTKPVSRNRSRYFNISGSTPSKFYFGIDDYIKNHVVPNQHGFRFSDPYYTRPPVTKEALLNILKCECKDDNERKEGSNYHCNCDDRKNCGYHHLKRCQCKKWTYYRRDSCMYCYLIYTRSKKIKQLFMNAVNEPEEYDDNDELLPSHYIKLHTSLSGYIPYFHYNQGTSGLCLGRGNRVIDEMIMDNINPVRIMLSFKANLAFSDHSETTSYYNQYTDGIINHTFDKYGEYFAILNNVHMAKYGEVKSHVFSMYCYCSQCLFYRVVLLKENRKINTKGFETNQSYIISRDAFIMNYKDYLNKSKSRSYRSSYIHEAIKQIVNMSPKEQMIFN